MVGARGFEPPTPGPPDRCANRAALRSVACTLLAIAVPVKHCEQPKSHLWRLRKRRTLFEGALACAGLGAAAFFGGAGAGAGFERAALIRSFMMLLALKTMTRRGVIGTISPVLGLRPTRSDFCRRPKEPKEESFIGSPRSSAYTICLSMTQQAQPPRCEVN